MRPNPDASPVRLGWLARTPGTWLLERCAAMALAGGFVLSSYRLVGRLTDDRHHDLWTAPDDWIPFWPATVWIYFPIYVLLLASVPFTINDRAVYYRTVGSLLLATVLCSVGFVIVPSSMPLPALPQDGEDWTLRFLAWVREVDVPNNTFPSQHVALSFTVALGTLAYRPRLGRVLLVLASCVALSTITTKQHYWIDTPGGIAVAILSHFLCFGALGAVRTGPCASSGNAAQ